MSINFLLEISSRLSTSVDSLKDANIFRFILVSQGHANSPQKIFVAIEVICH